MYVYIYINIYIYIYIFIFIYEFFHMHGTRRASAKSSGSRSTPAPASREEKSEPGEVTEVPRAVTWLGGGPIVSREVCWLVVSIIFSHTLFIVISADSADSAD